MKGLEVGHKVEYTGFWDGLTKVGFVKSVRDDKVVMVAHTLESESIPVHIYHIKRILNK